MLTISSGTRRLARPCDASRTRNAKPLVYLPYNASAREAQCKANEEGVADRLRAADAVPLHLREAVEEAQWEETEECQ